MRKGRRSLKKTIGGGSSGMGSAGTSKSPAMSGPSKSWLPVKGVSSMKDLPQMENEVKLVETMAPQLTDGRTNPNGAVGVVNYDGNTYCVGAACSCCKIPLTKAEVLPPTEETGTAPRLACDFCGTTYNIVTGEVVAEAKKAGIMGSIVKGVFSASEKQSLPVYALGEKSGQVLIAL